MEKIKKVMLLDWMRKIHTLEHAHRLESIRWSNYNNYFGIPSLIVAALISMVSSVSEFAMMCWWNDLITALGGTMLAILAGLQTFLKPSELAEKNRNSSITYEKLRHKIEFVMEFENEPDKYNNAVQGIRNEWSQIDALNVSQESFDKAKKWVNGMNKYPEELGFIDNDTRKRSE